ncbi:MAG: pyroglutamyl-peptidase I [Eubacterium sp.]|nr:pyroglutamyl-peptidase I [Eubacterium sp.]
MKILITGFDPFGGESVNPAYEAVKLLPDEIGGAQVVKLEVPTVFGKAGEVLEAGIKEHQPDAVVCVGQAGGRSGMCVEKVAINFQDARIKDNEGGQPVDKAIKEDGQTAYFATIPVKAMVAKMRENGIPAFVSYTAGTFVCNELMYSLLYLIDKKYPHIRGGFIHVPYAMGQTVDKPIGTPAMSLESIAKGLEFSMLAVVENREDISASMGTTH